MGNIFSASSPWADADEHTRRSLGQIDPDHPTTKRIVDACEKLKLKAESPAYLKPDCFANVALPGHKIAIFTRKSVEFDQLNKLRPRWEAKGWTLLAVAGRKIERLTDDELAKHLLEAIRWHGKAKR